MSDDALPISGATEFDALCRALDALNKLRTVLGLITYHLASLCDQAALYHPVFGDDGKLIGVPDGTHHGKLRPLDDFMCVTLKSNCEWLVVYIGNLWQYHAEVDAALAALPRTLLQKLDGLRGGPWLPLARRNCLDLMLKWPGEERHQTAIGAEKVYGTVPQLLKKVAQRRPFETWEDYNRLLGEYEHDLVAVRGEASSPKGPPPSSDSATPPHPPSLSDISPARSRTRRCQLRNALFLKWFRELTADATNAFGQIRDRWNAMSAEERKAYAPCNNQLPRGKPGYDTVRKAIESDGGNS